MHCHRCVSRVHVHVHDLARVVIQLGPAPLYCTLQLSLSGIFHVCMSGVHIYIYICIPCGSRLEPGERVVREYSENCVIGKLCAGWLCEKSISPACLGSRAPLESSPPPPVKP